MIHVLRNHPTLVLLGLPVLLLLSVQELAPDEFLLGLALILFGLVLAAPVLLKKHRQAYSQGAISRGILLRNILLEITGIVSAALLAGLLGRTIAGIATRPLIDVLSKYIAGILIGLLVGMTVGMATRRLWATLQQPMDKAL